MDLTPLFDELPAERRLALAYAPSAARSATAALLVLDMRLARIVGQDGEPALRQLRLAWWRDRLGEPVPAGGLGDPLLSLFTGWSGPLPGLVALVDGWEALLVEPPLTATAILEFAEGRGQAWASLAAHLGCTGDQTSVRLAATGWALAELPVKISDPQEADVAREMARHWDWGRVKLSRRLRPLSVLHGLARRKQGSGPLFANTADGLVAIRLGLVGH